VVTVQGLADFLDQDLVLDWQVLMRSGQILVIEEQAEIVSQVFLVRVFD
jgi:hypothetical protein